MADSQRVSYTEGQRISAADLTSEQTYLLGLDARHNLYEHVPGVALGLAAAADVADNAMITAGVAIDSQGKELLSANDLPSPADPGATCVDLWIVHCLVPLRQRQPGITNCSLGAFQRWREFGQIIANGGDRGRAPLAPYDGAVYLGRIECAPSPDVDFVAFRGQGVKDPDARTLLQVGPASGKDRNGLVVSATDNFGASTTRLAIDRLGRNVFWGDLTLTGYWASALLASPTAGYLIMAVAKHPGAAGEQIRARLTPSPGSAGRGKFDVTFLEGGKIFDASPNLAASPKEIRERLQRFNKKSTKVSLSLIQEHPIRDKDPLREPAFPQLLTAQDIPLKSSGGLELRKSEPLVESSVAIRDCKAAAPQDQPSRKPTAISFTPPAQPRKGTPLPGASAATFTENGKPIVQLRLDLGKKKDNDPFLRLAIGATDSRENFTAWLTGDGNGNLAVAGGAPASAPSISLNVTGRIEQAPVQADPTDPRFTALLVLAWLHGLEMTLQKSSSVQLPLLDFPDLIETGQPWHYQVTAKNTGGEPARVDKLLEVRTIGGQSLFNVSLGSLATISPGGGTQTFTLAHQAGDMGVGKLFIEVHMSGKIGSMPWWNVAQAGPIQVVSSPTLDISNLPSSAPPGAAFDYNFTVTNTASLAIRLTKISVTEGNSIPKTLPVSIPLLQPGDQETFGPIRHDAGISADLPVQIEVEFSWPNGKGSSVAANKTIALLTDLDIQVHAISHPIQVNHPWNYSLVLTNTGHQPLTLQSPDCLRQRLSSSQFNTHYTNIPLNIPIALAPGTSATLPNIAGTLVPATTAKMALEIQPTYQREHRSWRPQAISKDITLP